MVVQYQPGLILLQHQKQGVVFYSFTVLAIARAGVGAFNRRLARCEAETRARLTMVKSIFFVQAVSFCVRISLGEMPAQTSETPGGVLKRIKDSYS